MAYYSAPGQTSSPAPYPGYHAGTPPAPPPKPPGPSTSIGGPPLPPPPPGFAENQPSELDATQLPRHQHSAYQNIPPVEVNWLPETLKEKSTADLQHLLSDSTLQAALLNDPSNTHSSIPASQAALQPLIEANISLSNSLLQLEARLSQQRTQTQSRLLSLRALEQQHRAKITETEDALKNFSPMALYQRLNASMQEQDALVRGTEESWLEESGVASEREVADFVRGLRDAKRVAFLRRERKERWDEGRVGGWR